MALAGALAAGDVLKEDRVVVGGCLFGVVMLMLRANLGGGMEKEAT